MPFANRFAEPTDRPVICTMPGRLRRVRESCARSFLLPRGPDCFIRSSRIPCPPLRPRCGKRDVVRISPLQEKSSRRWRLVLIFSTALYGGPGKGREELINAISAGVRHFSVESDRDLEQLADAAETLEIAVKALLRINPISAPKAKLAMTGVASQFGFEEDVIRLEGRSTLALAGDFVAVVGIHIYWGTQISESQALLACFSKTVEIAEELSQMLDFPLEILNLGGGFSWPYAHEGSGPDLTLLGEGLKSLQRESSLAGKAEWWFESGRYLVGSSGTLLTRVMDIKRSKDEKLFLILDTGIHHLGGMAGLGRIPRFSIDLVVPPVRVGNSPITVDVVGQLCTPLDCIGKRLSLPAVEIGDLLAIPNTGAYGMTASVTGFLSRPSPAEVLHRGAEILSVHRLRSGHESLI
jgi:diaminopimelate decarboxylase